MEIDMELNMEVDMVEMIRIKADDAIKRNVYNEITEVVMN